MTNVEAPRTSGWATYVVLGIPILAFYWLLTSTASWLPYEDDYHALFGFALDWVHAHSAGEHLRQVIGFQHNEYKMPLLYSILGLQVSLTHRVAVPVWIAVGNLLPLAVLAILWKVCAASLPVPKRLLLFLPVVFALMNLNYAETLNFAICGVQELGVVFLSLLCILLITQREERAQWAGCAAAMLACGVYANAFPLALLGIPLFLMRKRYALFAAWCFSFAVMLGLFLYRYQVIPHARPHLLKAGGFFLAVVGCAFDFDGHKIPAILAGLLLLTAFAWLVRMRADRAHPFAFWTTVWLLAGDVLVTWGRASGGVGAALPSRYKIYGDLLFAVLYLQCVALWGERRLPLPGRRVLQLALVALAVWTVAGDVYGWKILAVRRTHLQEGIAGYAASHGTVSPMAYNDALPVAVRDYAGVVLTEALHEELYLLPPETTPMREDGVRY